MSQLSRQRQDRSGYLSEDSIAALATPVGGAVAIVRVSGPATLTAIGKLTGEALSTKFDPRKLVRVKLRDLDGAPLDDALVVYFAGPNSLTGEDCAEFQIHGGSFTAQRLLEALSKLGVRQALPGEFSFRAVRNGKMTLTQAEAVAELIAASNEGAVALALEKMEGSQGELIRRLAESLRQLAVLGELGIDFADQEVDEVSLPNLKKRIEPIVRELERLKSSYQRGMRLQEGVAVAFVGLPNAGKSSFFNSLLGEDRSIVSEIAGTTRDVVRERLNLRGKLGAVTLRLEDTAGLRSTGDVVEKQGIQRTQKAARDADFVLLIADGTAALDVLHEQWSGLGVSTDRVVGVITKADLISKTARLELLKKFSGFGFNRWLFTSAVSGEGISEAAEYIADFCEKWVHREKGEVLLTRLDHVQSVKDALIHMNRALDATEVDLFASDIRQTLHALGALIGETVPDDILGRIFSDFCIGK